MLGVGAHRDENKKIIVNCGDGLYLQEKKMKIKYQEYDGKAIFRRSNIKFTVDGEAWDIKKTHELIREISNYGFLRMIDYMLITGFIVLSPFASLLKRRPHLSIIGPRGCGKTTIIENIIRPAIGELGLYVEGKTSEAGIRQKIGRDCRATIIDEFEAHNAEEEARNKNILSLARSAYGGEGEIIKGTTNGAPITFKTKMMFCFLGINIHFDNDADRSRITTLQMKKSNEKIGKSFDFKGLRKRTFDNFEKITNDIEKAKQYILESSNNTIDSRLADTYGTLTGGYWGTISNYPFLLDPQKEINEATINAINEIHIDSKDNSTDEEILLDIILNYKLKITPSDEKTIAELLIEKEIEGKPGYDNQLKQIGIRKDKYMKIDGNIYNALAISISNNYIKDILKNSPYKEYKNILIRHAAILFDETKPIRMAAGKKSRAIILNWEIVEKIYFMNDSKEKNADILNVF